MIKILVEFCIDSDIIACPNWIVKDLQTYQGEFREWLYDEKNDHPYWISKGKKNGCAFRSQAFVEWLNKFVLGDSKEKANVIEECVGFTGYICRVIYPKGIEHILMDKKWDVAEWLQTKNENGNSLESEYIANYGMKRYFQYAATDWVNRFILNESDDKAYIIEKQVDINEIENMPRINF